MTGRPRSPAPRHHQIGVRLNDGERARLVELAGPGNIAEYLRAAGLGHEPRLPRQVPPLNADAWRAMAPTLGNLNQLTRLAHDGNAVGTALLPVIEEAHRQVIALRASLIGAPAAPDGSGEK